MNRTRALRLAALALAALWLVGLTIVMVARASFPLELEWMEGGTLHQAQRLLDGAPVYAEPSVEFVPFLYTPLYPAVVAGFGSVFGLSYALARAVSIACAMATGLALWRAVANEVATPTARRVAWLAPALFASGFVFTYRWLDVARGDAMFLAWALWGLVLLRSGLRREVIDTRVGLVRVAAAGLCLALAFWTKQTAALFIVAAGGVALMRSWRSCAVLVAVVGLVDGVGVLLGQAATDGWLWTYIYELHQNHAFNRVRFTKKTWGMFLHAAPFAALWLAMIVGGRARAWRQMRGQATASTFADGALRFWGVMFAAGLLASALGYSTQWAEANAFLPGVATGAVVCALALARASESTPSSALVPVGWGLLGTQLLFALLVEPQYQPIQDRGVRGVTQSYRWQQLSRTVPSAAKVERATALATQLRARHASGRRLFAPQRPWWPWLGAQLEGGAPRPGHVGSMGLNDVPKAARLRLRRELRRRLADGRWDDLYFEGSLASWWWLRPTIASHYRLRARVRGDARVLPMVGFMSEAGMVTPYRGEQLWLERIAEPIEVEGQASLLDFEGARHDENVQAQEVSGAAFGRGPVRSVHRKLPAVGPISGARLLSSAAGPQGERARGAWTSMPFALPSDARALVYRASRVGADAAGLEVVLVAGEDSLNLPVDVEGWSLRSHRFDLPATWAGREVQLRVRDRSKVGALLFDDLRAER